MLIRDIFATPIAQRIEPVVKVGDRSDSSLRNEITSLVVTTQWELHLRRVIESYADAADRRDEQGIGIWVSGFFGSGKSLLVKVLGALLEGQQLNGTSTHELFLQRVSTSSPDRSAIAHNLNVLQRKLLTTVVGGNLHAMQAYEDNTLTQLTFRLFAQRRGYTSNWGLAWTIEYQLDELGKLDEFQQRTAAAAGVQWSVIASDPEFYNAILCETAAHLLPNNFADAHAVERAVDMVLQSGVTPVLLVQRLQRWCENRDGGGRRQKLLIQLDELGQWLNSGDHTARAQQMQALIESAATYGGGRLWFAVTAHGDIQALQSTLSQEAYAKIIQRFQHRCRLTNDDISKVVEERLLRKSQLAREDLMRRFVQRNGDLTEMGSVRGQREYPTPTDESFALFYPYMPWTVAVIPDIVRGIARAAHREDALTGSNRTMIAMVQGGIIDTVGLIDKPIGQLVALADLYDQLAADAPIETRTDVNTIIQRVPGATDFTRRVARALYLLGEATYLPTTPENLVRALANALDADLAALQAKAMPELERLVAAGFAKQVDTTYTFLSTQQRTFQSKVRERQTHYETNPHELMTALRAYAGDDAFRFDQVTLAGRDIGFKLDLDGQIVRGASAHVPLRVTSQFQRIFDPTIADDTAMRQRANRTQDEVFVRLAEVPGLSAELALALATERVAQEVIDAPTLTDTPEKNIARAARQQDLESYKSKVRRLLGQAVLNATVFFRGTSYDLAPGAGAGAAMRALLAELLPQLYPRLIDLPQRITNVETAVKAALNNNTTNSDLQSLGIFRADGMLNDAHVLISTLRSRLPTDEQYQQSLPADALRTEFERPPFGWHGDVAKVGIALLLRAASCRLVDNSRTIADPADPDALLALTKDARFRTLRVQGVKSELTNDDLKAFRAAAQALFGETPGGVKLTLIAPTLHTTIGAELKLFAERATRVLDWSTTARCPLPATIESGRAQIQELLNATTPQARLPRFGEQAETLKQLLRSLEQVEHFRMHHEQEYGNLREFRTQHLHDDGGIAEVRRFVADWQTLVSARTLTDPQRWSELVDSYRAAHQAQQQSAIQWRDEVRASEARFAREIDAQLRSVGVPDTAIVAEAVTLGTPYAALAQQAADNLDFAAARSMLAGLTTANLKTQQRLAELRVQYQPAVRSTQLRLGDLTRGRTLTSTAEIDALLNDLRDQLRRALDDHQSITLE